MKGKLGFDVCRVFLLLSYKQIVEVTCYFNLICGHSDSLEFEPKSTQSASVSQYPLFSVC